MNIKFTEKAARAINVAAEIAAKLGSSVIGSEHILYGIVAIEDCSAGEILKSYEVDTRKIEQLIIKISGLSETSENNPKFTPRSKRIMDNSLKIALQNQGNQVTPEHILAAVIMEKDGIADHILLELGVNPGELLNNLNEIIAEENGVEPAAVADNMPGRNNFKGNSNKSSNTPLLDKFGHDLTQMSRENKLDPVIGRDSEVKRIMQVLCRRTKNNPCLIGEPGVGKTAVVEGLANLIASGDVPELLKNSRIFSIDMAGMVAGTKYRGEFEERFKNALDEVIKAKNVILFIDEIHTIIGAGSAEGAMDAANILKPLLSRGEIQIVGATTLNEYRKYIEKDSALERRFQPIKIDEPNIEATILILKGLRDKYEAHHNVAITDEALIAAVNLSSRYISDRFLPDKAIDLIDEASSRKKLQAFTAPTPVKILEKEIDVITLHKEDAIKNQEYESAAKLRDEEKIKKEELEKLKSEWKTNNNINTDKVSEEDIADIVSEWTGIPVKKLSDDEGQRLLKLEETLHERVVGQEEAVKSVARAIRRSRTGLKDPKRPIGSFIFLGPTGVGKTELSKTLAEVLFGDEKSLIRVDMSEYMEKHNVSRMVGSPPGYVGYDEGGQLTEKIRRKPYSVVLFDEIEKAHPDVFNILLQIMEDGRLTDSQGRVVDFKNTVIIMTSNVGARNISEPKHLGFSDSKDEDSRYKDIKANVMEELKKTFRPEFLNRVDDIIVFQPLKKEEIMQIARMLLDELKVRMSKNDIDMEYNEDVVNFITDKGYDPIFGARPLRRAIQSEIEDKLADKILGDTVSKSHVSISMKDNEVVFD